MWLCGRRFKVTGNDPAIFELLALITTTFWEIEKSENCSESALVILCDRKVSDGNSNMLDMKDHRCIV